jgi:predicted RNA-binding protein YlxR (DUF448 family)/ribosomal protein L7Ae-like RNA K-turn-binding protein
MVATQRAPDKKGLPLSGGARERRCIVTRQVRPAGELIRFVTAPDNLIVPDLGNRLPGRGFWMLARRDVVDEACSSGVFRKAAKGSLAAELELSSKIEQLLLGRCLGIVGMARRANAIVNGFEKTRASISSGRAVLAIIASDGARGGREKLLSGSRGLPVISIFSRIELGRVLGRDEAVFLAIFNAGIAAKLQGESDRLAGFRESQITDG